MDVEADDNVVVVVVVVAVVVDDEEDKFAEVMIVATRHSANCGKSTGFTLRSRFFGLIFATVNVT